MKAKEIPIYNEITQDRIKEKQEIIKNNNIIIDYMIKNNINYLGNDTIEEIQNRNKKLQEYINIAMK